MEMILLEVTLFCNLEIYLAMKMNVRGDSDWRKPRKILVKIFHSKLPYINPIMT